MKLALVRQIYNPYGGAERFVERAMNSLVADGLDVTLITRRWKQNEDGRTVRIADPFYCGRLWRDAGFAHAVQKILSRGEFDLVQSHERIPGCHIYRAGDGVHATWLELRTQVQPSWLRAASSMQPWHRYTLAAEAAMFRHARLRAVICNSQMVKDDIVRRFGVAEENLHVIHNGVDLEHFHPGLRAEHRTGMRERLGIGTTAPVILHVGSGFERKGVPQLLRALAQLPNKAMTAVFVGADRKLQAMRKLAQNLGLAERVRFVGGQPDVRPYYGMADVFALPTIYDPFPNAALEALACGLPVVTSTTCGAAEIVAGKACGRVCMALDVPGIAASLQDLIENDATCLAAASRDTASDFGRSDLTARLSSLYRSLLG